MSTTTLERAPQPPAPPIRPLIRLEEQEILAQLPALTRLEEALA